MINNNKLSRNIKDYGIEILLGTDKNDNENILVEGEYNIDKT